MTMSDLAYDANGYPIRLSPDARKWLLRKHRHKKLPQVMFRNGQRITLPIDASLADLRHVVTEPGRYRLLALDAADQPVEDMPEAYVELDDLEEEAPPAAFVAPPDPLTTTRTALAHNPLELLLLETVRANTELARATIDRIPDIMRASAHLVTASGALPRRPMYADDVFEDDDEDAEPAAPAPSLLETFLRAAMMNGGHLGGLGGFAKLLGVATPTTPTASTDQAATAAATTPELPTPPPAVPRNAAAPNKPANPQAHLLGILAQLTPDERAYAERVFAQLSPAAVQQWHELLLSMSIDDAVKMIRDKAAGMES